MITWTNDLLEVVMLQLYEMVEFFTESMSVLIITF